MASPPGRPCNGLIAVPLRPLCRRAGDRGGRGTVADGGQWRAGDRGGREQLQPVAVAVAGCGLPDYGTSGCGTAGSEETMLSTMNFVKPRQGRAPKYSL